MSSIFRSTSYFLTLTFTHFSVDTNHNRLMHKRLLSTTGVYKYVYNVCIKVLIKVFFAALADRASRLPKACQSWSYPRIL